MILCISAKVNVLLLGVQVKEIGPKNSLASHVQIYCYHERIYDRNKPICAYTKYFSLKNKWWRKRSLFTEVLDLIYVGTQYSWVLWGCLHFLPTHVLGYFKTSHDLFIL
jgi:hypothetical protein